MIQITVSDEDKEQLKHDMEKHSNPIVRQRCRVIYLKSIGMKPGQIAQIVNVHVNTITNYLKLYQAQGLAGLYQLHYLGQPSDLNAYQADISKQI
ncbi:MAG: hypothetical protein B6242_07475 [Anaerolineaceae bacterium 4572_78]|nr:MAG: hypothetical protein B6242_07475 [Anaerolineaceae bacterium 4572_78]